MLDNPILRRELTATLRGRWPVVLAAIYLVALAALVWFLWPAEGVYSLAAQSSRSVLLVFTVGQLLLVMLYAPAFGATAITFEKEQNSYELLFTTQLRPRHIIAGKLGSSVVMLLLFIALGFPLFAACFFLGAVSITEALILVGLTVLTAVFLALIGLAISARATSSHAALVATYLVILAFNVLPWLPGLVLESRSDVVYWTTLARAASPLAAVAAVVLPAFDLAPGGRPTGLPASWQIYFGSAAAGSVVALAYLVARVLRVSRQPGRRFQPVVDDPAQLAKRKLRFPFYLIDPMRRRGHIPNWINPIFARELRAQAFGGGLWIFRCAYLCLAGSMVLMVLVAGNLAMGSPDLIRSVAVVFQLGLIVLVVPALTVGAITQELERGNLDLLRQTRLTAWQWLSGKLLTAAVFVLFVVVGAVPLWFSIYYLQTNTLEQILVAWRIIGSTIGLTLLAGLFGSALARRTAVATGIAYGTLAALTVGSLVPLLLGDRIAATVRDAVLALNPFACAIQALTTEYFNESRELWRSHLPIALGLGAVFLLTAIGRVWRLLLPEK
jgi:ABC-type transport system involved in multi-copper enzyme maturation permease subunit